MFNRVLSIHNSKRSLLIDDEVENKYLLNRLYEFEFVFASALIKPKYEAIIFDRGLKLGNRLKM